MCECSGCLTNRAAEMLLLIGAAKSLSEGYALLEKLLLFDQAHHYYFTYNLDRLKLLAGPYGYTFYKMLMLREKIHAD